MNGAVIPAANSRHDHPKDESESCQDSPVSGKAQKSRFVGFVPPEEYYHCDICDKRLNLSSQPRHLRFHAQQTEKVIVGLTTGVPASNCL